MCVEKGIRDLHSAAIIGLGNIGMGYDYQCPDDSLIITHASAFHYHPAFELTGAVDTDKEKRMRFEKKFQRQAYASVKELFLSDSPQVIAISVPTQHHHSTFMETIQHNLDAVIIEKPISDRLDHAAQMVEKAREEGIAVLINYMRRFEPGLRKVKQMIASGKLGDIDKGVVWYSKGILNNGSHFIDLLQFLFGNPEEVKVIRKGRSWQGVDPEPDVLLRFNQGEIYLLAGKEEHYSIAEMEIYGTEGRLLYKNGGNTIEFYPCVKDPIYPGYRVISDEATVIPSELRKSQYHVLNSLSDFLEGKVERLASDGDSALNTLKLVDQIRMQL